MTRNFEKLKLRFLPGDDATKLELQSTNKKLVLDLTIKVRLS
jgi:hypothetical protein